MKVLLSIIFFHVLVILRAKIGRNERVPYISITIITVLMVASVMFLIFQEPTA